MTRLISFLLISLLASCAATQQPTIAVDKPNQPSGQVVIGIGAAKDTLFDSYTFYVRLAGQGSLPEKDQARAKLQWIQGNLFHKQTPDYKTSDESGYVVVSNFPPGDYEIFNLLIWMDGGISTFSSRSREDFSIPFTVRAGETTYLGNFQAKGIRKRNLIGLEVNTGAVFVVSDRMNADLEIAHKKNNAVHTPAMNATPDPGKIRNPFFVGS